MFELSVPRLRKVTRGEVAFGEPPSAAVPRLRKTTRGVAALASPRVPELLLRRDCGRRLEGWLLWRAPECRSYFCATIAEDDSRGGCFGEPPSAGVTFAPRLRKTTRGVAALAGARMSELLLCRDCGRRLEGWLLWRAPECRSYFCAAIAEDDSRGGCFGEPPSDCCATIAEDDSRGGCFGEPPSAGVTFAPRLRKTTRGLSALASPRVPELLLRRDCGRRLEGWLLWRAPECRSYFCAAIAEDDSRGGCFGEPPSAGVTFVPRLRKTTRGVAALASPRVPELILRRDCGRRLEGWLLWRAPECQSCFCAAIAEEDSRGGCFGEPPSAGVAFVPRL